MKSDFWLFLLLASAYNSMFAIQKHSISFSFRKRASRIEHDTDGGADGDFLAKEKAFSCDLSAILQESS